MADRTQLHATCITLEGKGVLLLGEPGSGKSDLAIRLIDSGAMLVADDRIDIRKAGEELLASAPQALRGKLEARGIGILTLPHTGEAKLALVIQLVAHEAIERLPEPQFWGCLDVQLPLHSLHAFDASTPAKIRLLLGA